MTITAPDPDPVLWWGNGAVVVAVLQSSNFTFGERDRGFLQQGLINFSLSCGSVWCSFDPKTNAATLLDQCQADADAGLDAKAMAGYVRALAGRYEYVQRRLAKQIAQRRERLRTECKCRHPRTATILAKLQVAFEVLLGFAHSIGAIGMDEVQELCDRLREVLITLVRLHKQHLESHDP
jgi:hypothetical protein